MTENFDESVTPLPDPLMGAVPARAASLPQRPRAGSVQSAKPESNLATAAAMFAVMLAAFVALAGFAAVGLGSVAAVVMMVPLGFGLLSLFHYVTWGWWMSQLRDEDES